MPSSSSAFEQLAEQGQEYVKSSYELSKLKGINATANIITVLISKLSIVLLVVLSLLMLSIAVALFIGKMLGNAYYGFLIVSVVYGILSVLAAYFLYDRIKTPIANLIISHALND